MNRICIQIITLGIFVFSMTCAALGAGPVELELHRKLGRDIKLPGQASRGLDLTKIKRDLVGTYTRKLTYHLTDFDSKDTGRIIAAERLKTSFIEILAGKTLKEMNRSALPGKETVSTIIPSLIVIEILKDEWTDRKLNLKAKVRTAPTMLAAFVSELSKSRKQIDDHLRVRSLARKAAREIEQIQDKTYPPGDKAAKADRYSQLVRQLSAADWYEKARYFGYAGEDARAIDAYTRAIEQYPDFTEALYSRSWFYQFQQKDNQKALSDLNRVIALDNEDALYYSSRGLCRYDMGDIKGAVADYSRVLESDPSNIIAVLRRAKSYATLGELKQAHADYSRAISLNPDLIQSHYSRAMVNRSMKDYPAAVRDFNAVLTLNPKSTDAFYERGITHAYLKDKHKVLDDFKAAAKLGHNGAQTFLKKKNIEW